MSLDVRWVRFEDSFEFGNSLSTLAAFGQHPPQIVSRTDKVRIQLDGGIELGKCFFAAAGAVKHDPEYVVGDCGAQGCGYGSARRSLGGGEVVCLESGESGIEGASGDGTQSSAVGG
jgi:hypothetical protein